MKLDQRSVVDQLSSEEPCLGAAFCTYTFDPAFFESHVLRSVLGLRGDPDEDAARYHEEARAALQACPVACFVDASVRHGGRRLPYDLHLVRSRTFHPKVYLTLFESEARLAIGSGNLTRPGFEQNTELFFVRTLDYAEPEHARLLREVDAFLAACAAIEGGHGTQLDLVRQALARRIAATPPHRGGTDAQFVSAFDGPLLDRLGEALPAGATITRIGLLAPFFEQDDLDAATDDGLGAVIPQILALRPSADAAVDIAVPWDDAPVAPPASVPAPRLDEGVGALWARHERDADVDPPRHTLRWWVLDAVKPSTVRLTHGRSRTISVDRADFEAEIADRRTWRAPTPTVFAPRAILERVSERHPVELWLHPAAELTAAGRPRRRPLHAKVIAVTVSVRGTLSTYVLTGSANASRSALTRSVAARGNVEAGLLCRFAGEVRLHDLLPTLVRYELARVQMEARELAPVEPDLSAWIEDVVHDAAARDLRITWRTDVSVPLGAWSIDYVDRPLTRGTDAPTEPTIVTDFNLLAASAEITLRADGREWQVPIRVADLAALPVEAQSAALSLRELLAILGRGLSVERLTAIRQQRGPEGAESALEALFGEGFAPTDVFKTWWRFVEKLQEASTVSAFRLCLHGHLGVRTVWQKLCAAAGTEASDDEVWVYGCELLRELRAVAVPDGPDAEAKRAVLDVEVQALTHDLAARRSSFEGQPWLRDVSAFYDLGAAS